MTVTLALGRLRLQTNSLSFLPAASARGRGRFFSPSPAISPLA